MLKVPTRYLKMGWKLIAQETNKKVLENKFDMSIMNL